MILAIDRRSPVPVNQQIADGIAARILMGHFRPGDVLPSVRDLAVQLGTNPRTVRQAYGRLADLGLVASSSEGEDWSITGATPPPDLPQDILVRLVDRVLTTAHDLGVPAEAVEAIFRSAKSRHDLQGDRHERQA